MKKIILAALIVIFTAGCVPANRQTVVSPTVTPGPSATPALQPTATPQPSPIPSTAVVLPIAGYRERRTFKVYGQYVQDRFRGYHTGDDIEYADISKDVPVFAIADGEVVAARRVNGYGGMLIIRHTVAGRTVSALYGHLDLNSARATGTKVKAGEQIAILGDHKSSETDGERKHLHFHLWDGDGEKLAGYAQTEAALGDYLNPTDFFLAKGLDVLPPAREIRYGANGTPAPHPTFDGMSFQLPAGWAVEYVPQIQSLNLFTLTGKGIARARSNVFIRTFTADTFLTLDTVTIHQTKDGQINGYDLIRYDLEKKPEVPDFPYQPAWRNARHIVTDLRANPGRSVFYVVAQNPTLPTAVYSDLLGTLRFNQ
ncbi:MAG: peptidase M23 [Parcubacteria group bacterium Gr01-1014_31]|nr:MAG: peptidase M23 [Parcubacteria group bacterium Gr01-1014_31]